MTRSVLASGTQTATIGTEHVLKDDTSNEGHVLDAAVDLKNMASGDIVELRIYAKVLSSSTLDRVYYARYCDSQDVISSFKSPVVYVPALTEMKEWELTLKQTAGTGRNFDWTIYTDSVIRLVA
jgi:hypothetical protein